MKKYIIILLFQIFSPIIYTSNAQVSKAAIDLSESYKSATPRIIPPSPQSQIFERFVNYPVREYNGLVDISIPLYEIKLKDLTIPISLSYHTGGIKHSANVAHVEGRSDMDIDGDIGAGWSINATGFRVIRTIRGKPDGDFSMYKKSDFDALLPKGDNVALDKYLAGLYYRFPPAAFSSPTQYDSEYDIFTYILPTGSAHFIYGDDKKPHIIEGKNDLISWGSTYASIKDDAGNTYSFGGNDKQGKPLYEEIIWNQQSGTKANTAWVLSEMETPNKEKIKFEYQEYLTPDKHSSAFQINEAYYYHPYLEFTPENSSSLRTGNHGVLDPTVNHRYTELLVSKIETDYEIITFNRGTNSKIIKDIVITDKKNKTLKKIVFEQNTPTSSFWHSTLSSVVLNGETNMEKKYSFSYYDAPPSTSQTCVSDQWGYYTNQIMTEEANSTVFLHSDFDEIPIMVSVVGYIGSVHNMLTKKIKETSFFKGHTFNRSQNKNSSYFSLKSITYPTGGITEFVYEPNMFYKEKSSKTATYGGGQRIKTIKTYSDDNSYPLIVDYKYGFDEKGIGKANMDIDYKAFYNTSIYLSRQEISGFSQSNLPLVGTRYTASKTFYVESPFINMSEFNVNYDYVTKYEQAETLTNQGKITRSKGKTVSKYTSPNKYTLNPILSQSFGSTNGLASFNHSLSFYGSYIDNKKPGSAPQITEKKLYDENGKLVMKENYNYTPSSGNKTINGLKLDQKISFSSDYSLSLSQGELLSMYTYSNPVIGYTETSLETGVDLLQTKSSVMFSGNDSITMVENYIYDDKNRLKTSSTKFNNEDVLIKDLVYPTAEREPDMYGLNIVAKPTETITKRNGKEIGRIKNIYNKSIYPTAIQTSASGEQDLRTDISFDKYDKRGNILQITDLKGLKTTYLWSYNSRYPIAEINNLSLAEVETQLGTTADKIADLAVPDLTKLTQLQKNNNQVHVSLYTYKPFNGMESSANPAGITNYYEYDQFRRLTSIKDYQESKITEYFYSYNNGKYVSDENIQLNTELYTPMKLTINTEKTYPVNKKFDPYSILVEGGSLNLNYDWTLKLKSGKIIKQELNSSEYSFNVGKILDSGEAELICTVKDLVTGKTKSISKDFKFVFIPIENIAVYPNTNSYLNEYIGGTTYPFSVSLDGGSGYFTYDWYLYNQNMTQVIREYLNNTSTDISIYLSSGNYQLVSLVRDKITGDQANRISGLTVMSRTPVGFTGITNASNHVTATFYGGQNFPGATIEFEIVAYVNDTSWGRSSVNFNIGGTSEVFSKPGKKVITTKISNHEKFTILINKDSSIKSSITAYITIKSITPNSYTIGERTITISK